MHRAIYAFQRMGEIHQDVAYRARPHGRHPKLAEMGFGRETHGRNAIASGFEAQRQHTPARPNGTPLSPG